MAKRLPKDAHDWYDELLTASISRYEAAVRNNRVDQNHWKKAVDLLKANRGHIYIQKGGINKGIIVGIPPQINRKVIQTLDQIVRGEKSITDDSNRSNRTPGTILSVESKGTPSQGSGVALEETSFYKKRRLGDSVTALLSAMYVRHPQRMTEEHIQRAAQQYTEHDMRYDWRTRQHGAWKAMTSQIIPQGLVQRDRDHFSTAYYYHLTPEGLEFCKSLFTLKFHPSHNPAAPLVEPRTPLASADRGTRAATSTSSTKTFFHSGSVSRRGHGGIHFDFNHAEYDDDVDLHGEGDIYDMQPSRPAAAAPMATPKDHGRVDLDTMRAIRCSKLESNGKPSTVSAHKASAPLYKETSTGIQKSSSLSIYDSDDEMETVLQLSQIDTYKGERSQSSAAEEEKWRSYVAAEPEALQQDFELEVALALSLSDQGGPSEKEAGPFKVNVQRKNCSDYIVLNSSMEEESFRLSPPNDIDRKRKNSSDCDSIESSAGHSSTPMRPPKKKAKPSEIYDSSDRDGLPVICLDDSFGEDRENVSILEDLLYLMDSERHRESEATASSEHGVGTMEEAKKVDPRELVYHFTVDLMERKDQKIYREFFVGIRYKLNTYMPDFEVHHEKLTYGDFAWTVEHDKKTYCLDFIVERKTINDIVSRSCEKTGPHFRQVLNLFHCGLKFPFLLVEGDLDIVNVVRAPRTFYIGQSGPDVIATSADLMIFLAQMLAKRLPFQGVGLLQSRSGSNSGDYLSCLSYFAKKEVQNSGSALTKLFRTWGQFKTDMKSAKTDNKFEMELVRNGVHVEMAARVFRRFGNFQKLREAYGMCTTPEHAANLLNELSPSTRADRATVLDGIALKSDDYRYEGMLEASLFDVACTKRESRKVFEYVTARGPRIYFSKKHDTSTLGRNRSFDETKSHRVSHVQLSEDLRSSFSSGTADTDVAETADSKRDGSKKRVPPYIYLLEASSEMHSYHDQPVAWATVTTSDTASGLNMYGCETRVIILPGLDLVESLIDCRDIIGAPEYNVDVRTGALLDIPGSNPGKTCSLDYCYSLVQCAVLTLFQHRLPPGWSFEPDTGPWSCRTKYQIILEDLPSGGTRKGVHGILCKALAAVDNERVLDFVHATQSQESLVIRLDKKRKAVSLPAAKDIEKMFWILIPMLVTFLNVECNWDVFQSKHREESLTWLHMYFIESHRESLLFYDEK